MSSNFFVLYILIEHEAWNVSPCIVQFRISWFSSRLTKTNKINISYWLIWALLWILKSHSIKGPTDITPIIWKGQVPSWSLISLYMIRGIPNYGLYNQPFYGWRLTSSRHTTPHVGNHGDLKSKDHIHHHHYENCLWHSYNDPCSVLMAG